MKKICWISAYLPNPTPFASISYMIIKELLKLNNFEFTLITFNDKPINTDLPIKIYPIIEKDSFYAIVKTLQVLKKENFDIIHIISARFNYKRLFYTIAFLTKFFLRVKSKIIISAHEFYDFSNLRELIIGGLYHLFLLRFSDIILVFNRIFPNMMLSKSEICPCIGHMASNQRASGRSSPFALKTYHRDQRGHRDCFGVRSCKESTKNTLVFSLVL
ncbi:hypothetical protein LCGC14_2098830 [marine sediment metagenome]|uniref:Glycosyltransferase subfamily 4-like N-terminal domain-containing protein n=1 Tax=marine sediment metagenome TaxID=412755 RepID=A0A0F9EXQ8_9ZZZZ